MLRIIAGEVKSSGGNGSGMKRSIARSNANAAMTRTIATATPAPIIIVRPSSASRFPGEIQAPISRKGAANAMQNARMVQDETSSFAGINPTTPTVANNQPPMKKRTPLQPRLIPSRAPRFR